MRIALSAFLLLLLALTALAGNGCKRPLAVSAATQSSLVRVSQMAHLATVHPLAQAATARLAEHRFDATHPTFVFCHPRLDQLADDTLTAAAAQVAFDLQATNDDRTEMITADFDRSDVPALPQAHARALHPADSAGWPTVLLRPPKTASTGVLASA
ncbi:hypothetical protein GN316_14005 [Xylophilus sp. Kf1]|nr:hypothetical protein [Xylophilus sp. Kf1]